MLIKKECRLHGILHTEVCQKKEIKPYLQNISLELKPSYLK